MICRIALCLLLLAVHAGSGFARSPKPGAANREAMKKLEFLAGKWKGDATVMTGPGAPRTVKQTEDVQYKLGGAVMLIEGVGRGKLPGKNEEGVVFNALGIVSYDEQARKYKIKAYRLDGQSVDADLTVTKRTLVWEIKEPQRGVEVRYTMKVTDEGEWDEVGEYTRNGKTWTKFIDMTLTREKETP